MAAYNRRALHSISYDCTSPIDHRPFPSINTRLHQIYLSPRPRHNDSKDELKNTKEISTYPTPSQEALLVLHLNPLFFLLRQVLEEPFALFNYVLH